MEVTPPDLVWERLSLSIDEINADNKIAGKLSSSVINPPSQTWDNIVGLLDPPIVPLKKEKVRIINFRTLAAAAAIFLLVVTSWILLTNKKNDPSIGEKNIQQSTEPDTSSFRNNESTTTEEIPIESPTTTSSYIASAKKINHSKANKNFQDPERIKTVARPAVEKLPQIHNDSPGEKSFDKPIDDLSLITSDENYMTMVNGNGRLAKIPAHFAHLAPHLQGKPISEDLYEVMFGEGTYWQETLSEWRKKIVSMPVSSGDAFTGLVEMLKTVQNK